MTRIFEMADATTTKLQGELLANKAKGLNHVHVFSAVLQICFSNTHAFLFRKMIEQLEKEEDLIRKRMAAYRRETLFENLPVLAEIAAVDVNRVSTALKELDTTISPQDKMATCQAAYNACVSAIDDLMKTKRRSSPFEISSDHVTSVFVLA